MIRGLTKEIYAQEPRVEGVRPEVLREILEMLSLMLAPMTPHLAEELWEMLGHSDGLWNAEWPYLGVEQVKLAHNAEVEIPVQVNGRVRGRVKVEAGTAVTGEPKMQKGKRKPKAALVAGVGQGF